MAILSKIRERSWLLIVIIGMALFAFVASPQDIMDFFNSSKVNSVGEVNGEVISREEFSAQVEAYKANTGNRSSQVQAVNAVWNSLLSEKLYSEQLDLAGVVIGEKDIWDAIVNIPSIQGNPAFQNEIGMFDENMLKEYLATIKLDAEAGDADANRAWVNWLQTERNVKRNLEQSTYAFMLSQGASASLKEGEQKYQDDNTQINAKYVYLPYTSVPSADIKVTRGEIESYMKSNSDLFQTEALRDIEYVRFELNASESDEKEIFEELASLNEDREEYNSASKTTDVVKGFKNTDNTILFIEENGSDLPVDNNFYFKNTLSRGASDQIFAADVNSVVGPYKEDGYLKISKVMAKEQMPDSVRASHILIPFVGSRYTNATLTREEAQKRADSILSVVNRRSSKFAPLAKEFSADVTSAEKGGDLDWFGYNRMVEGLRDFSFSSKKGTTAVIETEYGFHVVKVTGRKNVQTAVRVNTLSRKIIASEFTENSLFEKAESFAFQVSEGSDFNEYAKENSYTVLPINNITELTENISVLGPNRQVVRWAFEPGTEVGAVKRFDLDNGSYAVIRVAGKTDKGLMSAEKAVNRVRPILEKQKKAEILIKQMKGSSLKEISDAIVQPLRSVSGMTMAGPTIVGIGREIAVVGAMAGAPIGELVAGIEGKNGVFAIEVISRKEAEALPNYETFRNQLVSSNESRFAQVYEALQDAADVTDNRAMYY
jgi:peptidylprolyl isomerase/peptidyl-prolyl cis-trans isomerase D